MIKCIGNILIRFFIAVKKYLENKIPILVESINFYMKSYIKLE